MKVLVDTNVLLDVLIERIPFYAAAMDVWSAAEERKITALASAVSFATIFYVARKAHGADAAHAACAKVAELFEVAAVDAEVVTQALASGMRDFEDAMQAFAAVRAGATHVVSRDVAGFRDGPLPALTPESLVNSIRGA